ncbi:GTP-binding protein [Streptomyces sp. NPDC005438]|uniref:CobW family GTP-binding protein n=1 Tax=Streptomyces sp. NPDC005438 TaxID=3156880 RepID=UPI0033B8F6A4
MTSPSHPRLPVALVAGLHREARRATVDQLLATVPGSVALHHDLAAAPDGHVRRTRRDRTEVTDQGETPLVNDCACCALREDLVPELERLADSGLYRLAVVELWDSVEPRGMAEVIASGGADTVELTSVITAVDPALLIPTLANGDDLAEAGLAAARSDQRTVADTCARQLEYAPVLSVHQGETPADQEDQSLLRQLTPGATQVPVDSAELARAALAGFDVQAAAERQHPALALLPQEAEQSGVHTLVWRRRRPFHPGRLYAALEELACAAIRSRGRFWLADRPDILLAWDCAGGALCVEGAGPWLASLPDAAWDLLPPVRRAAAALDWDPEHGDRGQHLVFTSPDLDVDGLRGLLDACLLTDEEYEGGPTAWKRLPPAFDVLLDHVS